MRLDAVVLWIEADWRCELRAGPAGTGRLVIYKGDRMITGEGAIPGSGTDYRAEILRQRVIRGDLRAD